MNKLLKDYYDKYVLSVHALIVFTIFCFLLEWKIQTQSFSLLLLNYLLILKILPVTCFKDPTKAIFTLKMLTGSCLWFCKIIPKAAGDKLIFGAFSLLPMRGRHWRTSTNHREGNFEEGFSKHFQDEEISGSLAKVLSFGTNDLQAAPNVDNKVSIK